MNLARVVVSAAALAAVVAVGLVYAGDDAPPPKPSYVGDKECQKCHFVQHRSWKKGAMAVAMKKLAPTAAADDQALFDRKKLAGLDPAKDYAADATCLPCHVTGYGEPGGYPKDAKPDDPVSALMGKVSCEACHGPGSLYVKHKHDALEKDKAAKFTWEELAPLGLTKPDVAVCAKCHEVRPPTRPCSPPPAWFVDAREKVHEHPAPPKADAPPTTDK